MFYKILTPMAPSGETSQNVSPVEMPKRGGRNLKGGAKLFIKPGNKRFQFAAAVANSNKTLPITPQVESPTKKLFVKPFEEEQTFDDRLAGARSLNPNVAAPFLSRGTTPVNLTARGKQRFKMPKMKIGVGHNHDFSGQRTIKRSLTPCGSNMTY